MKKTLLLSAVALFSHALLAANTPTKLVLLAPLGKAQLYTAQEQAAVFQNLKNVSAVVSGSSLKVPVELALLVPHNYDNAFFDPMSAMMISPYQIKINGSTKHPNFSRVIEMHEYGHALFDENFEYILGNNRDLIRAFAAFRTVRSKIKSSMRLVRQGMIETELIGELLKTTNGDETSLPYKDAMSIVSMTQNENARIESLVSNDESVLKFGMQLYSIVTAYNEFFADVLAVIISQNPNAIAEAITLTKNNIDFSDRGFRVRISQRAHSPEVHNFYTLSREFIYKHYLSDPVIRAKGKSWILVKTLQSISCALDNEAQVEAILKDAFNKLPSSRRTTWPMFELEGKNQSFNNCIEAAFEAR